MSCTTSYKSSYSRLMKLPEVFRGTDLTMLYGWTSKTASQYLWLWSQRGLVEGLGGHSDVYVNKFRSQDPNWGMAVRMAMPSSIVVGLESLRLSGWSTQIPRRPQVAVARSGPSYSVKPYEITRRSARWFREFRQGCHAEPVAGIPTLRPAWALADMLANEGWRGCGLDPDDIDWETQTEEDAQDWARACAALGMDMPPLQEMSEDNPGLGLRPGL